MAIESLILEASEEAQALLDGLYRETPEPAAGLALDQAGLRDGLSIVRDYLKYGEAGVAFDHLMYMIKEPELKLSRGSCSKIRQAGEALGLPERAYAGACGDSG